MRVVIAPAWVSTTINGAKLEEFVEVGSVEGIKNGSVIKFEEGEIIMI